MTNTESNNAGTAVNNTGAQSSQQIALSPTKAKTESNLTRILMIYTGGTIGMCKSKSGYVPVAGYLGSQLATMSQFHDPTQTKLFTTPESPEGKRAQFDIKENTPLLDSSNMSYNDWVRIAEQVQEEYNNYDAFIILHGTDTMAYTCCALSFMFQNLDKTVILTGSQIPISQTRNDGFDNLLGALQIAMHYEIPEVCMFFNQRLFRGNRVMKIDAGGLAAFDSYNLHPLAKMGIEIDVNWSIVRRPPVSKSNHLELVKITTPHVGILRLFPGISDELVENFLKPPMKGCVLLTYGSGNAPDNRETFLKILREACNRGVVIVNVTQCMKGTVTPSYQTGVKLYEAGVVSGYDMTPEAATTKLMYLLSQRESTGVEEIKNLMQIDLRGELTPQRKSKTGFSLREKKFVHSVAKALCVYPTQEEIDGVQLVLLPVLACSVAALGELEELKRLLETVQGAHPNVSDYDLRTPLHIAASENQFDVVKYLVEMGANVNALDRWGQTPLDEAESYNHTDIIKILIHHGAKSFKKRKRVEETEEDDDSETQTTKRQRSNPTQ